MSQATDKFINIGRITRAHGVRGEMSLDFYSDSTQLLEGPLFMGNSDTPTNPSVESVAGRTDCRGSAMRSVRLLSWRQHHAKPLIRLEGVNDRTQAELLRGQRLFVRESDLPELADDELYIYKIIGLKVHVLGVKYPRLEAGEALGEIAWVDQSSGQELWGIVTPDGKEVLFPAVDEFIVGFDLEKGLVRIAPPEGLLELYLGE